MIEEKPRAKAHAESDAEEESRDQRPCSQRQAREGDTLLAGGVAQIAEEQRALGRDERRAVDQAHAGAAGRDHHAVRHADQAALHAGGRREPRLRARPWLPRRVSLHARRPADDVSRQAVDDAHVRGLRRGRGDQRALQVPALAGADGPLGRLRHGDALRLRPRPPDGARRVRQVRRRGLLAGRHGDPLQGHPARPGHDLDDHQQPGAGHLGDVHRRRREAGRPDGASSAARCRTTSSRSTSRRRSSSSRRSRRSSWSWTPSSSARAICRAGTRSRSPATTSARRARRRCRSWPSRWRTGWRTWTRRWSAG